MNQIESLRSELSQLCEGIPKRYRNYLFNEKNMPYFVTCFITPSVNLDNNYNFLKTVGHVSYDKILVWYMSKKIPNIFKDGQKKATLAKNQFNEFKKLGNILTQHFPSLWKYISITDTDEKVGVDPEEIIDEKNKIFQFVFEAIIGAIEYLLDQIKIGLGNIILTKWLYEIFDRYFKKLEVGKHPKSLLNDIVMSFNNQGKNRGFTVGKIDFETTTIANPENNRVSFVTTIQQIILRGHQPPYINKIGEANGYNKSRSEIKASLEALRYIIKNGIIVYDFNTKNERSEKVNISVNETFETYL